MNLAVDGMKGTKIQNRRELEGLRLLYYIYSFFVISAIVMPQYFGIHIGYDITCLRLSNLLLVGYFLMNTKLFTHFVSTMMKCEIIIPLGAYLCVAGYTMVFRADINAFFLVFFEILSLFLLIYGIRYVLGVERTIRYVIYCAYFLGFYGLIEFAYGRSIFLQFLRTVPTAVTNSYRSGHYRIMGPCGHPLGYGLVLLLFIAIACLDVEKNEIYLFKRPVLLVVLLMNVFLTGSRSTLGIAVAEVLVILLLSNRNNRLKSLVFGLILIVALVLFLLVFHGTSPGQYILGQIMSVVDQVLGTSYAVNFGVDVTTLENSENYREVLPYVFTLDWLNPLLGRGSRFGGAEINGVYVHSIDNYYVLQYIKYAYPGLVTYVLFMLVTLVVLLKHCIKNKSVISKIMLVGIFFYYFNMWWVDALQTLKYVYIFIAIFYAHYLESKSAQEVR